MVIPTWCVYFHPPVYHCGGVVLRGTWLMCSYWCVSKRGDLVGQRSRTALTVKIVIYPLPFFPSSYPVTFRCKAAGLLVRRCEPWICQPLTQGDVEILASSCSWLCNGEPIGRPWSSQIYVYTYSSLVKFVVALSSDVPDSCALLVVLAPSTTLWGSGAEKCHFWRPSSVPVTFCPQGIRWPWDKFSYPPSCWHRQWQRTFRHQYCRCWCWRCSKQYLGTVKQLELLHIGPYPPSWGSARWEAGEDPPWSTEKQQTYELRGQRGCQQKWDGAEGGGGSRAASDSNSRHNKYKTELTLLDKTDQTILKRGGPQKKSRLTWVRLPWPILVTFLNNSFLLPILYS